MCKIPKVLLVAPADRHADLRRALSSIEYDIVAAVTDTAEEIKADVAVVWEPSSDDITALRERGLKTVGIGADSAGADMNLSADDIGYFKKSIWLLFRPK